VTGTPPADEQLEFLKLVAHRLESTGIPYMFTGSIALAIYATPRMTRDVDVIIECDARLAQQLVAAFADDSYVSEDAVREAIRTRGTFNVIHREWLVKADFFIRKDDAYRRTEFERRRSVDLGGFSASVVTPEDLILSKLVWALDSRSDQQARDVRDLLASAPGLDWEYLVRWADALGVRADFDRGRA
jgi:hypothetical protein